jgi:putative cell wall-binding protein
VRPAVVAVLIAVVAASLVPSAPAFGAPGDATVFASGLDAPSGLAVAPDGSVYVTAGDTLQRIAPDGGTTLVASGLTSPRGVAVLGEEVYVAEATADRVVRLGADGVPTPVLSTLDGPTGLATDGTRLFVAVTNAGRVDAWVPGADAVAVVADSLAFPTGVAVDGGGALLVADTFNRRVLRNGTVIAGGGTSTGTCTGDGGPATSTILSPPTAVAADGVGNVYIADAGNGRVVRVAPDGVLTTIAVATFPSSLALDTATGDLLVADSAAGTVVRIDDPATAFTEPVDRIAGADRYATAAQLSARLFPPGVPAVFVATGEAFPDALAASGAAGASGGPVLLARRTSLPDVTAAELRRLRPGRVVVLGGAAALSDTVADAAARAAGVAVAERHAGSDRYATAAALSSASFPQASTAVVTTGDSSPDSLSGGAAASLAGAPLLLARLLELPEPTAAELRRLRPARVVIVGGEFAVSAQVEAAIRAATGGDVQRLAGADRFATSAVVADTVASATTVLVATGYGFPDGLAAAAAAKRAGGPVLLVPCFDVPAPVRTSRARFASAPVVVVGGPVAVPNRPAVLISRPAA